MDEVAAVLTRLRSRGVQVWAEAGQVRFKGPRDVDNAADLGWLSDHKAEALTFLAAPSDARLPLSLPQRMWVRPSGSPPGDIEFHRTPALHVLTGPLDADALAEAVNQVVARHPQLRVAFTWRDGAGFQSPAAALASVMGRVDLSTLPEATHDRAVWTVLKVAHDLPADFTSPQRLRSWLFKLDDRAHVFATLIDHVILDNRSARVIHLDIFGHYHALVTGDASRVVAQSGAYADYVLDNLDRHNPERLRANLAGWRDRFAGIQPLDLRDPAKTPHGDRSARGHLPLFVPPDLTQAAHAFAQRNGQSLSVLLSAAFGLLLSRAANVDRVLAAYILDDRTAAMANTVGCFVRSGPFFLDLAGRLAAPEVMDRARDAFVGMINPERTIFAGDLAGLRRVMINIQMRGLGRPFWPGDNLGTGGLDPALAGWRYGDLECRHKPLKPLLFEEMSQDLQVYVRATPKLISGHLAYAADRLAGDKVRAIARDLPAMLRRFVG